jgi:hypothetical protein
MHLSKYDVNFEKIFGIKIAKTKRENDRNKKIRLPSESFSISKEYSKLLFIHMFLENND